MSRQVRTDALPALALVGGFEDVLRRGIERLGISRRDHDREGPLKSFGDVRRRRAHRVVRPDVDRSPFAGAAVDSGQQPAVAARVEDVDVSGIRRDVAALAATDRVQLVATGAGHARGRVVLLGAAHVIRNVRGRENVVELRGRIVLIGPALAGVCRHVGAAVVAVDHPRRIGPIDPQIVVITVWDADRRQRLARIGRAIDPGVEDVHGVARLGVGVDAGVIERALAQPSIFVDARPGGAGVVRKKDAAVGGFDDRVDPTGVRSGNRYPHLAPEWRRQAARLRQLRPGLAAVARLEEPAPGPAARQRMRRTEDLPESGIEDVRICRIHRQVCGASLLVPEEHVLPALAAIDRFEDAAFRARTVGIAQHGRVDDVRVGGVDAQPADDHASRQADVRPGATGICGLVDAVSLDDVAAQLDFAHAGIHHVRLRFGDGDRADRRGLEESVRHRSPGDSPIGRFPKSAARRAEVVLVRVGWSSRPPQSTGRLVKVQSIASADRSAVTRRLPARPVPVEPA